MSRGSCQRRGGSRFKVQGAGFRVQSSEFKVQGSGFRVQGSEFKVQSSRFRIQRRASTRRDKLNPGTFKLGTLNFEP